MKKFLRVRIVPITWIGGLLFSLACWYGVYHVVKALAAVWPLLAS